MRSLPTSRRATMRRLPKSCIACRHSPPRRRALGHPGAPRPEPYREIVDEPRRRGPDLIIIRRRGRPGLLANLLLGEMVSKVVAHAPCSVLINAREAQFWRRRVLVAVDPAAVALETVALAARVAVDAGLPLAVVCVAEAGPADSGAQRALAAAVAHARSLGAAADGEVLAGKPHAQILDAARRVGADLIVLGRHGATRLSRAWIGSVAQKVVGLASARCWFAFHRYLRRME